MAKINAKNWKEIKLSDIFEMNNTNSIVQKSIVPDSGKTPYVTAQAGNNGILTYVDCPEEWIEDGNCIMIGGKTLTFSYQEKPFCSNDSHNIALYLKNKDKRSEMVYLFLITALRASLSQKYTWGDSISMKRIKNETFYIPVTSDGEPDWDYMSTYMQSVMTDADAYISNLRSVL